jgi:release factor glutamine methyltransferase
MIQEIMGTIMECLRCRHPDDVTARQQDAWWILQAITGKTEAQLLASPTMRLTLEQHDKLVRWLSLHIDEHMPLQYLIGSVPFGNVTIATQPPVLIPRPETEEWTLKVIERWGNYGTPLTILDLCSGSGCIAISLAQAFPSATVYAVDISDDAVALSRKNCELNDISNVRVIRSDLFTGLPRNQVFDLIVSNPPYIALQEWQTLDPAVSQWEDKRALVADNEGLAIIETIVRESKKWLLPRAGMPQLVIEIGYNQGVAVGNLYEQAGYQATIHKDLEGKDRTVWGSL